jgi:hypothetical protein
MAKYYKKKRKRKMEKVKIFGDDSNEGETFIT